MQIEYDPKLIEQAVFLACRQDRQMESKLHAATDPLYTLTDRRAAEAKFQEVYAGFFTSLELDSILTTLLSERPLIEMHVGRCIVHQAVRRKDESAELFVKETGRSTDPNTRTLIICLCPASLIAPDGLAYWLRRELLHTSDMLDERFAYRSEALDGLPARQNLIRDHYRVLWDIFVQGRLSREGNAEETYTRRLSAMFQKAFSDHEGDWPAVFQRVFRDPGLTHRQLLDWAGQPETLFDEQSARQQAPTRPSPGGECPLCGFPTYDWFGFQTDRADSLAEAILASRPDWHRQSGACRQCAEIYAAVAAQHRKETGFAGVAPEIPSLQE